MRRLLLALGVGTALLGLALVWPAAIAKAAQGFGVSPTSQEVTLEPGAKASGKLTIINDGDTDVTYKLYATDYTTKGEDYRGNFTVLDQPKNISPVSWFALPAGSTVIKARQQMDVAYTITVPADASLGGHYGAVFAETIPPQPKGGALVARVDRVGSLFYLAVGGDLRASGGIKDFQVPLFQAVSPVTGTLRLANTGNVHYSADVSAQLWSPFGKVGRAQELRGEVLPSTTRRFNISLPSSAPIGLYNVKVTVNSMGRLDKIDRWMLLMPKLTFAILSATLLLVLSIIVWSLWRKLKKRRAKISVERS